MEAAQVKQKKIELRNIPDLKTRILLLGIAAAKSALLLLLRSMMLKKLYALIATLNR